MSDFVERLRKGADDASLDCYAMCEEAAARIEALEEALRLCVIELRQMPSTEGDSKWRALKKAQAALVQEQDK